jgi:tetratricopeptide (TPR) repeat protein
MLAMLADSENVGAEIAVPPAIQALLAARLDRLEPDARRVLACASIEGEIFHVSGVADLLAPETRETVASLLMSLVRKELIRPEPPDLTGDEVFGFRHALIRDAAYEALSKESRAELHARHAAWLERAAADRADEYDEFLGYHFEQAFRYRAELHGVDAEALRFADGARHWLTAAGRLAFRRGDIRAVVNLLERARGLPAKDERSRLALAPDLGFALFQAGELERAEVVLSETIDRGSSLGERHTELHAWLVREASRLFWQPEQIDIAESIRKTRASLAVLVESGDDIILVRAWSLLRLLYGCTADEAARRETGARALEHARRAGSRLDEAFSLIFLGWLLVEGSVPVSEGIRVSERLLRELANDPLGKTTIASAALANLMAMEGRFREASTLLARSRTEAQEFGLGLFGNVVELVGGGRVETRTGDLDAAERTTCAVAERSAKIGDNWGYAVASLDRARVVCDLGRPRECLEILEESEQHPAPPDIDIVVKRPITRALALARLGRPDEAEPLAREALRHVDGTQFLGFHADALLVLAEVLRLAGRPAEVVNALEEAVGLYERKGNVVSAAKARSLLAELT